MKIALTLAAALVFLSAAGIQNRSLTEHRRSYQLQTAPPEHTTPLVSLITVAFGGFRGLVADALWIRAAELQQNGDYFELVQLANWITQLEPRIPEVWSFQAWNLAYNISVLFPEPADRWRWVQHGIALLRDQGLQHNPGSPDLHWDLGWMYQHKIGFSSDQAHFYYKQQLADDMNAALGSTSPDLARLNTAPAGMDLDRMRALEKTFGRMDWRLPHTHALYWAELGRQQAKPGFRRHALNRMVFQSLADLVRAGRVVQIGDAAHTVALPRLDLIQVTVAEYERAVKEGVAENVTREAMAGFLMDAVLLEWSFGSPELARRHFSQLAAHTGQPDDDATFQTFLRGSLQAMDPQGMSRNQALQRVIALLWQARALSREGLLPQAEQARQLAQSLHQAYQDARQDPQHRERTGLPAFEMLWNLVGEAP